MRKRRATPRTREQESMFVVKKFNDARPLEVRLLRDGRMGVVSNDCAGKMWMERDFKPSVQSYEYASASDVVTLPDIPDTYGSFVNKSIGGVSDTVRRQGPGICRVKHDSSGPYVLFATSEKEEEENISSMVGLEESVSIGDSECVDGKWVTEIIVHDMEYVDCVCARLSRHGISCILEDASVQCEQPIGIERLDRIDSSLTNRDEEDDRHVVFDFGLGRGDENWKFHWIPSHWQPPITWDYLVMNVLDVNLLHLPYPLRQHVATFRLKRLSCNDETGDGEGCRKRSSVEECTCERCFLERQSNYLKKDTRKVSASLSNAQSKQLIQAFYLLTVERISDPVGVKACCLIMYRYLVECGYLARWIGAYKQKAHCVGNGTFTRVFNRLWQYDPSRIPTHVLNRLLTERGELRGEGSKGSRSKYVSKDVRYVPKARMRKSRNELEQARMKGEASSSSSW